MQVLALQLCLRPAWSLSWLAGWLGAWQCSCQRQSLLLGLVVTHYGDLARTKMGAKNTHELWDMKFESVAVPD